MLNEVDPAVNRSTANGSTTVFPYTFLIYDQAEIEVLCDTTVKTLTTDYTVSGVGVSGGGNIVFVSAPANGLIVTRMRKQPAQQQSDYIRNEAQPSERIEQDLDKLGMMVQQIKEVLRRCLTFTKSSSLASQSVDEPTEGLFARWKTGGGIDWATPTNASPASLPISIANGGTGATTAAAARTALDVPSTGTVTAEITAEIADITLAMTSNFTMFAMAIQGLTYTNSAGDAVNDLDFTSGFCRDATNTDTLTLAAMTKRSDAAWAVGTNQGALDTGAVGNNDYYIWGIKRPDTGVTDRLYSLSSTAPTMPANYTLKRLIGWFKRVGGTVVAMTTYETEGGGIELLWSVPTLDISLANTLTTTRRTDAVKVPLNFSTVARLNVGLLDVATFSQVWIYCPDQADAAPSITVAPLANAMTGQTGGFTTTQALSVRTSAIGTIAARTNVATVDSYLVSTISFTWARRN